MKIGIIGCGNMGGSIAARLSEMHELFVFNRHAHKSVGDIQAVVCDSAADLMSRVEVVILAVKPKDLEEVADAIKGSLSSSKVLISVLAGTPISVLRSSFAKGQVVRIMPNLAVRYGEGVVGIAEDANLTEEVKSLVNTTLAPLGSLHWMPEKMIDALASLTGSGPAFSMLLIESMIEASVAMGFKASTGKDLVVQMLSGTLKMLTATGKHPAELKLQVTSPGGTTIAGLRKLEEHAVRFGVQEAFIAALERAHAIETLHDKKS